MKKALVIILIVLITAAAVCGYLYFKEYESAKKEADEYVELHKRYVVSLPAEKENTAPEAQNPKIQETIDFEGLLAENNETVGWIKIKDTPIDYPVLQAKDNEKYLTYSFSGKKSNAGAVFMDYENKVNPLDSNTIIYGHHLKNRDDMFGSLLKYKERGYCEQHRYIQFDTLYEKGRWLIFAVLHIDVAGGFNYLRQSFADNDDFLIWANEAKSIALWKMDTNVQQDDKILTLSTCDGSKYGRNGRLVVMAVKTE